MRRFFVESVGARIACFDFGGSGKPAVLLHGLYGAAHEWQGTASWLSETHHVFAIDQRGHGESSKELDNLSLDALAADAVSVIERVGFPVLLLGQSIGGLVALIVAGRRPELVDRLVVVEAHASSISPGKSWLSSWPASFANRAEATQFFKGQGLDAQTWIEGLENRGETYWPRFSRNDMAAIEEHLGVYDHRAECAMITAPALVLSGATSWLAQRGTRELAALIRDARFVEVARAGHDVHLDQPETFRDVVLALMRNVPSR